MVDQRFHGEAMRRQHEQFRAEAKERAQAKKLARIRAQFFGPGVIMIDAPIGQALGEISARWLRGQLPSDAAPVVLLVHSEGGSVFEAFALIDLLKAYPGRIKAVVSGFALSAASLLLTAADEVEITLNSYLMLHHPRMDDAELSPTEKDLLESLSEKMVGMYAKRSRQSVGTIRRMMAAETFLDATEAVRLGFADRIVEPSQPRLARTPAVVAKRKRKSQTATARWATAVLASGSVTIANRNNPGLRQKMLREVNSGR